MTALGMTTTGATRRELKAVKRFFNRVPKWAFVALAAAAPVAVGGLGSGTDAAAAFAAAGAGLAVVAMLRILPVLARRPSGRQMDEWLNRDLTRLRERAVVKCGLEGLGEATAEPVVLSGPVFGVEGADFAVRAPRRDIARFTPVGVTILNFREHQIFAYQCALDRLTGNALDETTDEYFYRDVVSVSTRTETLTLGKRDLTRFGRKVLNAKSRGGKVQVPGAEVFTLTTSGGTSISVVIGVVLDRLKQLAIGAGGDVHVDAAERALAGIRQMLREKKIPQRSDPSDGLGDLY